MKETLEGNNWWVRGVKWPCSAEEESVGKVKWKNEKERKRRRWVIAKDVFI